RPAAGARCAATSRVPQRHRAATQGPAELRRRHRRLPEGHRARSRVLMALSGDRAGVLGPQGRGASARMVPESRHRQSESLARVLVVRRHRVPARALRASAGGLSSRRRAEPRRRVRSRQHRATALAVRSGERGDPRAADRGPPRPVLPPGTRPAECQAGSRSARLAHAVRRQVSRPMNRAAAIAVMLAALWTTPGAAQPPGTDTDPRLARTWRAYRAGRFDEALAAARLASAALPSSGPALLAHGWMAEYLGEFDEAQSVYAKARTVASDDPDVLLRVASFSVRVGEYDDAVALLDRVLAGQPWWIRWAFLHAPTFAQAAVRRGNAVIEGTVQLKLDVLMEKGQLAEARRVAREYRVVQPARDYCGEARQRGATGPREEIFLAFRLAALAQPDAADCIWWYGQWLTDEGFVRLGRVMVIEGTRVTPSAANKASGERYLRVRLSNGREVSKR